MNKKNEKRICWNCDGEVSHHLSQCPYCGVDLSQPAPNTDQSHFQGFGSPFQSAPEQDIPKPPFASFTSGDYAVSEEEWNQAIDGPKREEGEEEEDFSRASKREMVALLLLLPGVVFFLFGLALILFSTDGVLSLEWNQNLAYFYFLGALPLLYLGYRALR